ncbi:extensin-like [Arachis ipaensis]|uniref:extensin-like n=1 Tax=Arachis ipaensis TaxID=130454 RepID=UPI0007AFB243|nr:extensin-like [Arachis ipaensis]XP_025670683.1 extensin-like [Arachis hypogaea]
MKRRDRAEDYVHPWLCMESLKRTYSHCIKPVLSAEFWPRTEYSQPEPPIIKRPIGRPKVHNRQKDPAEPLMQGGKLKKSFSVACSKCGEKGYNYKTCKGAPSNPNWKPKTKKPKKKEGGSSQQLVVLPLSQSAPTAGDSSTAPNPANVAPAPSRFTRSTLVIPTPGATVTPFRPPAPTTTPPSKVPGKVPSMVNNTSRPKPSKFIPKQKIFRPPAPLIQG